MAGRRSEEEEFLKTRGRWQECSRRFCPAGERPGLEALFTLIAEGYECWSLGITSNLVFSESEKNFANRTATAAAMDRCVHHSVILEFDLPSYRTNAAQSRQAEKLTRRQE